MSIRDLIATVEAQGGGEAEKLERLRLVWDCTSNVADMDPRQPTRYQDAGLGLGRLVGAHGGLVVTARYALDNGVRDHTVTTNNTVMRTLLEYVKHKLGDSVALPAFVELSDEERKSSPNNKKRKLDIDSIGQRYAVEPSASAGRDGRRSRDG
jgi:hypothetical protein